MDDAVQQPEKKNCTFLFKRRKIRGNASRKRKEADGDDGEHRNRLSIQTCAIYRRRASIGRIWLSERVIGYVGHIGYIIYIADKRFFPS